MRKHSAFTLVELLIVISIITVLSGLIAKIWGGMERMSDSVHRNTVFIVQSRLILDRIREDIRQGVDVSQSERVLLSITQRMESGKSQQIVYRMDGNELVRDRSVEDRLIQSSKVLSMKNLFLDISFLQNRLIRLEMRRPGNSRPMELKNHSLATYVVPGGES